VLEDYNDDDVLLFVDAFDVLLTQTPEYMIQKFLAMKKNLGLLISCRFSCCFALCLTNLLFSLLSSLLSRKGLLALFRWFVHHPFQASSSSSS
jgi:hypothetical protein